VSGIPKAVSRRYSLTPPPPGSEPDWPTIILAHFEDLAARGGSLPSTAELAETFGVQRAAMQMYIRALSMRGQLDVVRDRKNGRLAVYAPDGLWRLEKAKRSGVNATRPARRCLCCRKLWEPPHKQRWLCDKCTTLEVMGS
jgi:hypothetical protein